MLGDDRSGVAVVVDVDEARVRGLAAALGDGDDLLVDLAAVDHVGHGAAKEPQHRTDRHAAVVDAIVAVD